MNTFEASHIRHFLNAKTGRPVRMHVEQEQCGVLIGMLCHAGRIYPATLIEVAPGIWEREQQEES
jgi:hypothetical protein